MNECSLIVISRISAQEDDWIRGFVESAVAKDYELIVVGHTDLDPQKYNFKYVEFWDNGIDAQGLVCHKKNLGVQSATKKYSLVNHADTYPSQSFFSELQNIEISENEVISPMGDGITWAYYGGIRMSPQQPFANGMYISGATILARTELFKKFPWNESLGWNKEEDVEYSNRLHQNGVILRPEPKLVVDMHNSQ